MCRNLTVVIDCACSKRVLEIFEKIKNCDCVKVVLFHRLEMSFCIVCGNEVRTLDKMINIINYHLSEENNEMLYYVEEPLMCVERVFR
jgi:hypothetical protein